MSCPIQHHHFEVMETEFDAACMLAEFAADIDLRKNAFPPALKALAAECVDKLHAVAQMLAGDRAGEIYAPDDGSEDRLSNQNSIDLAASGYFKTGGEA